MARLVTNVVTILVIYENISEIHVTDSVDTKSSRIFSAQFIEHNTDNL